MRDEPNAVGIRTKRAPDLKPESFWVEGNGSGRHDSNYFISMVENDFAPAREQLARGIIVIIPSAGLGTGFAKLEQGAPRTFRYLQTIIEMPQRGRFEVPTLA